MLVIAGWTAAYSPEARRLLREHMKNQVDSDELLGGVPADLDDDVARLLARAGQRTWVPDDVTARVKAAAHTRWRHRLDIDSRTRQSNQHVPD